MIECVPRRVCSWDYRLVGPFFQGEVHFDWLGECGTLEIDRESYDIRREGFFDKRWHLISGGGEVALAKKTSVFHRAFGIEAEGAEFDLRATGFGRSMELSGRGHSLVYRPKHPFTKRAEIEGQWTNPGLVAFGFWLTVMLWKRSANSAAASGG
jgi:hypothetical protein